MFPALTIVFPNIDPVAVQLGDFGIRWYALSYIAGLLLGLWYAHYLNKKQPAAFTKEALDDLLMWVIGGIIIGGRLGYVFFYQPEFFMKSPQAIFMVWEGGMSFHGGLIGVIVAIYLMCRMQKIAFWPVIDICACVTPIGLGLGRIANFINAELVGRVTVMPWGVVFPGESVARHPSQLYEAFLEGFVLFVIMWACVHRETIRMHAGMLSGIFLIGYGMFRSIAELFREPDKHLGFLLTDPTKQIDSVFGGLTMGQALSIPMILFGIYLIFSAKPRQG